MGNIENILISDASYKRIDGLLSQLPPELRDRWESNVEMLGPAEAIAKLEEVVAARSALASHGTVHFSEAAEQDPQLKEGLIRTITMLENSHGDPNLYLGEGNVAEVYRVNYDPRICIKSVVNEDAYRNGNTIYQEGSFLEQLNGLEVDGVRTPKFYFYHDTLRLRSLGMETIEGTTLSMIVTGQVDVPQIRDISVDDFYRSLTSYVEAMHDLHIFHGDLFDRNIMFVPETGEARVIDFGKSKQEYFDQDIRGYDEGDFEILKSTRRNLEHFLRGEKVDLK